MRLAVPPLTFYACDVAFTLAGQTPEYWAGDMDAVLEANPAGWHILRFGPAVFLSAAIAWALAFTAILAAWRHPWSRVLAFCLTLGHALGAATWMMWGTEGLFAAAGPPYLPERLLAGVGLVFLAERLLSWSWREPGVEAPPPSL
jgi:hypothetical protein